MSTAGVALAEYPTKTNPSNLSAITSGPDGNLWFLENTEFGAVGRITKTGVVTEYKAQMQNFENGIIAGPDGAIWYAQGYPNVVARVTTKGIVSTVPLTALNAVGNSLTVGPDHKIWVAEGLAGALGRLSAIGGTGLTFTATHAVEFTGNVASFVDGTPTASASDFTATIYWGDGATSKSTGTVTGSPGGPFDVSGSHTYSAAGTFHPYVILLRHRGQLHLHFHERQSNSELKRRARRDRNRRRTSRVNHRVGVPHPSLSRVGTFPPRSRLIRASSFFRHGVYADPRTPCAPPIA
jgi:hypothetical protein